MGDSNQKIPDNLINISSHKWVCKFLNENWIKHFGGRWTKMKKCSEIFFCEPDDLGQFLQVFWVIWISQVCIFLRKMDFSIEGDFVPI